MKRLLFIFGFGLFLFSCSDTNNISTVMGDDELEVRQDKDEINVCFTWEKWGRSTRSCDEGGLCSFRPADCNYIYGNYSARVESNKYGSYIDIIPDAALIEIFSSLGDNTFYVDDDIIVQRGYNIYRVLQGQYQPSMGSQAGYFYRLNVSIN